MRTEKSKIVIVIPMYKSTINENEKTSLEQLLKVLGTYKIVFAIPKSLSFDVSILLPDNMHLKTTSVERYNDENFTSVVSYSKLLLTKKFYEPFVRFEYMLIYQLDSFVFYDALQEWASKGYDYIGAPWIKEDEANLIKSINTGKLKFVFSFMKIMNRIFFGKKDYAIGNGGMSLRNIRKSILVLNRLSSLAGNWKNHEDIFWSMAAPVLYPFFKVPNMKDAFNFSFERNPEMFLELNNNQLPFGCHAWEKYSPEFWNKYIISKNETP